MKFVLTNKDRWYNKEYFVDEDILLGKLQQRIESGIGKKIKLPRGPVIDLEGRSVLSTLLRQLCSMFIIPYIEWMAQATEVELPKRERHENSIKYAINAYFLITHRILNNMQVTLVEQRYVDDMYTIVDAELSKENSFLPFINIPVSGEYSPKED